MPRNCTQVLMNLCVNAPATPCRAGGTLAIEADTILLDEQCTARCMPKPNAGRTWS